MLLLLISITSVICTDTLREQFEEYKIQFHKNYTGTENEVRFHNFVASLERVEKLNEENPDAQVYGLTRFSDWSQKEKEYSLRQHRDRKATKLKFRQVPTWNGSCAACVRFPNMTGSRIPSDWDWRDYGAVTPVKDQGRCGDCFTFGGTGDIEGAWYLAGNPMVSLSEQQLTSCDRYGNDGGCRGSATDLDTFQYVINAGGICSEEQYPFSSKTHDWGLSGKCDESKLHDFAAQISGMLQVSGGDLYPVDEDLVKSALFNLGPMAIGVNAEEWDDYDSGIYHPKKCKNTMDDLDHEVLMVGYGEENSIPYWLIKNSWTTEWGEEGYIRVFRGDNVCGIVTDVTHSVV